MSNSYKIAVLPGDGIGPEVTAESVKVLNVLAQAFQYKFEFEYAKMGAEAIFETGNPLPEETLTVCKNADAVLFGAIGDPYFDNNPDAKVRPEQGLLKLRKELGLFANIRPIKTYSSITKKSPLKKEIVDGTDIQIYRELISGIYFGEKFTDENGEFAYDICKYNKDEIVQIAHLAFQDAQKRRKKLTLIDKANVLDTSRLWRKVVQEIAKDYPDVTLEFLFVDNAQAKGKGIANPIASILSAAMLLDYLKLDVAANKLREAVEHAIDHRYVTEDLNKEQNYSTSEVGDFIVDYIKFSENSYYNFENVKLGKSTIV